MIALRCLLCFLILSLGCNCKPGGSGGASGNGKPVVFVSVLPQVGIVKRLVGDAVEVQALVGAGQDPHNYAATPKQSMALGKAYAIITCGMPFEEPLMQRLEGTGIKIIDSLAGLKTREGEEHGSNDDHAHHDHALDPHVWLAPEALRGLAQNIAKALTDIVPSEKDKISENLATYEAELDALHAELTKRLKPHSGRTVYVYHPAFGYFTDAYQMWQESVEIDGKTPTQKELAAFMEKAKKEGMRIIFVQPQFDKKSAEAIAQELGARVESLDALSEDAIGSIRKIADAVEAAFAR